MRSVTALCIIVAFLFTMGCSGLSDKQQKTMTGGLIGAAGGPASRPSPGQCRVGAAVERLQRAYGYIIGEKKERTSKSRPIRQSEPWQEALGACTTLTLSIEF